mgnify:CR=1 FL=1
MAGGMFTQTEATQKSGWETIDGENTILIPPDIVIIGWLYLNQTYYYSTSQPES